MYDVCHADGCESAHEEVWSVKLIQAHGRTWTGYEEVW